jgi:Uma2 family endonuclease
MKTITSLKQLDLDKKYTYADYLLWRLKERVELIKGKILEMSPAPNRWHQELSTTLIRELIYFFESDICGLYTAPFDVRLKDSKKQPKKDSDYNTVVQPDICVVCDRTKLDDKGCAGSPDLVIEILSPGNSKREMRTKFRIYEENKIPEYWIVEPANQTIFVYVLQDDTYIGLAPLTTDDKMNSKLFPKMKFPIKNIFKDIK